jgi:LmbE family N-acetylglucosaminyl deacetylase
MLLNQSSQRYRKRKKQAQQLKGLIAVVLGLVLIYAGHWLLGIIFLLVVFIANELLWSDHIFFPPRHDDQYFLEPETEQVLTIKEGLLQLPEEFSAHKTNLLKIEIKSGFLGRVFDPYLEFQLLAPDGEKVNPSRRQYFERGAAGKRYLNISHIQSGTDETVLLLKGCHCTITSANAVWLTFDNPEIHNKKILVVAPHADDAELAAFGLYHNNSECSYIVTITAGETGAPYYKGLTEDREEACRIKGLLRAFDSVSIPRWGGLDPQRSMQLGYFCLTLEEMRNNPSAGVVSRPSGVSAPGQFRVFNPFALKSESEKKASWNLLVQDIAELIDKIKPDIIVTPHPLLDPHPDHVNATCAVKQASSIAGINDPDYFLYANHYHNTDMFPFGLAGTVASLPPVQEHYSTVAERIYSHPLSSEGQKLKTCALGMMHDLTVPLSLKKKLRLHMQKLFLGRKVAPGGADPYFRKAIRSNELFYVTDQQNLTQMLSQTFPSVSPEQRKSI